MATGAEIVGAITTLISVYPFNFEQTVAIVLSGKALIDMLFKRQWKQAQDIAYSTGMELFEAVMDDGQKRDAVVAMVYDKMPKLFRDKFSEQEVETMVEIIYNMRVKKDAQKQGLVKGEPEKPQQ